MLNAIHLNFPLPEEYAFFSRVKVGWCEGGKIIDKEHMVMALLQTQLHTHDSQHKTFEILLMTLTPFALRTLSNLIVFFIKMRANIAAIIPVTNIYAHLNQKLIFIVNISSQPFFGCRALILFYLRHKRLSSSPHSHTISKLVMWTKFFLYWLHSHFIIIIF